MNKRLYLLLIFVFLNNCSNQISFENNVLISVPSCNIEFGKPNDIETVNSEIYIVGHAYGKPGEGDFFPKRLEYFLVNSVDINVKNYLALTGDFVREPKLESFKKIQDFIKRYFDGYFISVGNHELNDGTLDNFYKVFNSDFYYNEFENYLLIASNHSNSDWLPTTEVIEEINFLISNTEKKNIIILSHQLFWLEITNNSIKPNSDELLEEKLPSKPLDWIQNNHTKNFIVISGDYGAYGAKPYCKQTKNAIFIASGIGDTNLDSIIKIVNKENSFGIYEILISGN